MDTKEFTENAKEMQEHLEDEAHNLKGQAEATARHWKNRIASSTKNVGQTADRYVHDYAWSSVATAALLGCVVGYFLGRSRD